MRFHTASKAPIGVNVDGVDYLLPRFLRPDWLAWAAEIDGERLATATEGLTPLERSKLLMTYPLEPSTHAELSRRISTPEGTGRVVKTCASRATPPMPDDVLKGFLEGDERDLETLAWMLASVVDTAEALTQAATADADEEGKAEESPLSISSAASSGS